MNQNPDPHQKDAADAAGELARIKEQIRAAQAQLDGVRKSLASAQDTLGGSRAARLVEANERLVLATIAAQKAAEASALALKEVSEAAQHDPLTELPNRVVLRARLPLAMQNARQSGECVALLMLDLTDFQHINDTLGHEVGDRVLRQAARCLRAAVRESDMVSRHGSDEFLILLAGIPGAAQAVAMGASLVSALGVPTLLDNHVVRLSAAVGISLFPDDGDDPDRLIDCAVAAMYRAKWRTPDSQAVRGDAAAGQARLALHPLESLRNPLIRHEEALAKYQSLHVQLLEANTQLVVAALRAQDLQAVAERAQRRQTELMSMVAHELRHPLAPIRNAAAILGRMPERDPVLVRTQAIIERQVGSMARLVGDLVDVARVRTGKLRIESLPIDLIAVLDEVVEVSRPAMDARLQQFAVFLPFSAIEVNGDAVRLAQVFNNLLDNASKYTPQGGDIRLSVMLGDGVAVVTVSDSGIGISADALPHIFDPFVQDPHATEFDATGLGIGLTVVRELVEAHGGTVVVTSQGKGLGAEFVVTLPLLGSDPQRNGTASSA